MPDPRYRSGSFRRFAALGALLAALSAAPAHAAAAPSEPVIVMPPFEVKDVRPWLFVAIPGHQILSLASERETREFAQRMAAAQWLTPLLLPPGFDGAVSAPSSLFLRHFDGDRIATKVGARIGFPAFSFSVFWQDTSLVFPSEEASRAWGNGEDYLGIDFMRATGLAVPRVPGWYRDGMGDLLRTATATAQGVTIPGRSWKEAEADPGGHNPALARAMQKDQPRLSLPALFAAGRAPDSVRQSTEAWRSYLRTATLFVHWGFFSANGHNRAAFLKFVALAAERGPDEAMVQDVLGLTVRDLETQLARLAWGSGRHTIAAPLRTVPPPPVLVREATHGEVAGILGEAYLRLAGSVAGDLAARQAYLIHARKVLEFAHEAGEADAMVHYQLAMLAQESGAEGEADWLQRAVEGKVARPSAYTSLAKLRLQQLADRSYGERLSAADTTAIWSLLTQADSLRPRLATTYSLGVAMWQNSSIRPSQSDLVLLANGVDSFPEERNLTLAALRLFLKLGVDSNPFLEPRVHAWHRRLGTPGY